MLRERQLRLMVNAPYAAALQPYLVIGYSLFGTIAAATLPWLFPADVSNAIDSAGYMLTWFFLCLCVAAVWVWVQWRERAALPRQRVVSALWSPAMATIAVLMIFLPVEVAGYNADARSRSLQPFEQVKKELDSLNDLGLIAAEECGHRYFPGKASFDDEALQVLARYSGLEPAYFRENFKSGKLGSGVVLSHCGPPAAIASINSNVRKMASVHGLAQAGDNYVRMGFSAGGDPNAILLLCAFAGMLGAISGLAGVVRGRSVVAAFLLLWLVYAFAQGMAPLILNNYSLQYGDVTRALRWGLGAAYVLSLACICLIQMRWRSRNTPLELGLILLTLMPSFALALEQAFVGIHRMKLQKYQWSAGGLLDPHGYYWAVLGVELVVGFAMVPMLSKYRCSPHQN